MKRRKEPSVLSEKTSRLLAFLLMTALFLAGLLTSTDYGLHYDEPAEQVILRENLKEYAYQLWGDGSEALRYYNSLGIRRISESEERDHGQSAFYPAAPLLALAERSPDTFTTLWHAYTWLWFMAGVLAIYGFGRDMGWSRAISCAAALLYYLAPRFFAEGHYNNKDVVLLSLVLLVLWIGLRLLRKPGFANGLGFSLLGAVSANTKIAGFLPWGLVAIAALIRTTARREWNARLRCIAVTTAAGFCLFYALLTPALWNDPARHVAYLLQNAANFSRWTGVIIYRGIRVNQQIAPIPRLYLPVMMALTLPLYTLPLFLVGQWHAFRSAISAIARHGISALKDERRLMLLCLTMCWFLPLGYAVWARPIVYNGWRHFYFAYAGIALLAGHGMAWMAEWPLKLKRAATALLCLCFTLSAIGIALNHPFQYGYYNLLAQKNAATDMELDYWGVSSVNAMKRLSSANSGRNEGLPLVIGSRDNMSFLGLSNGYAVLPAGIRRRLTVSGDGNAPYLFYNTTYALIYGVPEPDGYRELLRIESYGNILSVVYERILPD